MRRRSEKRGGSEEKEVEELLRAAEDEMLLKFSVNSHTTRSNLDLELLRRFETLKSPSSVPCSNKKESSNSVLPPKRNQEGEKKDVDILTRFEALKGKGGGASSSSSSSSGKGIPGRSANGFDGDESENEEDEVAKVIQWAMDAARLDPSKSDDEDDDFEDDDYDDDDDDHDRKRKPKK